MSATKYLVLEEISADIKQKIVEILHGMQSRIAVQVIWRDNGYDYRYERGSKLVTKYSSLTELDQALRKRFVKSIDDTISTLVSNWNEGIEEINENQELQDQWDDYYGYTVSWIYQVANGIDEDTIEFFREKLLIPALNEIRDLLIRK